MSIPYVSLEKQDGKVVIRMEMRNYATSTFPRDGNMMYFPLTKAGCLAAGKHLHATNNHTWMNSSSVDWPQELKRSFKYNIRELMSEGYRSCCTWKDIAECVIRNEALDPNGMLMLAIELIHQSGVAVRPEVLSYLNETVINERAKP